jgi:hypothetical protein
VSLLTSHSTRASVASFRSTAGEVRASAGVAQLVEHLFCKQVVSGSIPLASSTSLSSPLVSSVSLTKTSEGCPSGQREQAVNLPARAYVGSNPTPSTNLCLGSSAPPRWNESSEAPPQVLGLQPQNARRVSLARRGSTGMTNGNFRSSKLGMNPASRGFDTTSVSAGVTQLVESQFSKLKVVCHGSSAPPRWSESSGSPPQVLGPRPQNGRHSEATIFAGVTQLVESQFSKLKVDGSSPFSRSNFLSASRLSLSRAQQQTRPATKIAGRRYRRDNATHTNNAHLAQLVEHVLGKDEVISSNLMVGSNLQP